MNELFDHAVRVCLKLLAMAVAVYVAVRLIESVTAALVVIAAVTGGLLLAIPLLVRLYRRYWSDRW